MKTRSKIDEWWRWSVAKLLDLFPDTCWSAIVGWAMYDDFCIQDIARQECKEVWCGKCAFNGRLDEPEVRKAYRLWKGLPIRFKPFADFCCDHLCGHCPQTLKAVYQGKAMIEFK